SPSGATATRCRRSALLLDGARGAPMRHRLLYVALLMANSIVARGEQVCAMRRAPSLGRSRELAREIGLLLGLAVVMPARAAVIAVPADHATIQHAVDAAAAGDGVRVSPGVYVERGHITGARPGLTVGAADPADPPLVQGKPNTSTDGIQVDGVDAVTLRALRVVSANTGVRLTGATHAVLENLQLENDGLGIWIVNGDGN